MIREAYFKDTVIIGAGPAGLAVGACLKRAGVPFVILERSSEIGAAWRKHYDRLHLHTDKRHSNLPYYSMPKHYPKYPSRLQVVEYLEAYATFFNLEPGLNQNVTSARFEAGQWEVRTEKGVYRSNHLVIATGYAREPNIPSWPGQAAFGGPILHSSDYKNGKPLEGRRVLVVGFGNSGGEIAIDLLEHGARPSLSVRRPVNVIPRDFLRIPILTLGIAMSKLPARFADALSSPLLRYAIGDLRPFGLRKLPYGPFSQMKQDARIPLIDVGTVDLIKNGRIPVHAGIERFTERSVIFTDGKQIDLDAVILATGYRPGLDSFLENVSAATDEYGCPTRSGEESSIPGLYFCGFYVSPTGMLREIGIEAEKISKEIERDYSRDAHSGKP